MKKDKKNKKLSNETILFASGITLFIVLVAIVVYSFVFIVNDIMPAITSGDDNGGVESFFDLEGFEELGL